jgi:hypothetical protein
MMFIAAVENEGRGLVKYLAYQHGMGWYLTFDEKVAYAFPSEERQHVADTWSAERRKFFSSWGPKVTYLELMERR